LERIKKVITFAPAFDNEGICSLKRLHKQLVVQEACTENDLQQWSENEVYG